MSSGLLLSFSSGEVPKKKEMNQRNRKIHNLKQLICFLGFIFTVTIDLVYLKLYPTIQTVVLWYFRLMFAIPLIIIALKIANQGITIMYNEIRDPPCVIKRGPFRFSRHPMYLSALLIYLGIIIASFSILGLIYFGGVIILYNYLAQFEEKHLLLLFRGQYELYSKQVPRWIKI
jgi:protein-S-isoprenylcysteine O-methyltransferase Ste14